MSSQYNDNNGYIVPERKLVAGFGGPSSTQNYVESLNGLTGIVGIEEGTGIVLTTDSLSGIISISLEGGDSSLFVLKTGDFMSGNLQFQGLTNNEFGLGLWTSNTLNEATIANKVTGAMYFNTSTIRFYDGSNWRNINFDALTQSTGDTRYLQLTGGTLTGQLIMSNMSPLTLYSGTTPPTTTNNGSLYFDNTIGIKQAKVYVDGSWLVLGQGSVTSINTIAGITGGPITTSGTISLDLTYNPIWTGNHTFTKPIVFANNQTFNVSQLTTGADQTGDLIYYDGTNYNRLAIGSTNQIIHVQGGLPVWAFISGATISIGIPDHPAPENTSDTTYTDGYFGGYPLNPDINNQWASGAGNEWTPSTEIPNAIDDINQTLWLLAGSQAGTLTGTNLGQDINSAYLFTANLSAGLSGVWTNSSYIAGTTITTYVTSDVTSVDLNSDVNTFRCGKAYRPYTYGNLSLKTQDGSLTETVQVVYDLTAGLNSPVTNGIYSLNVPFVTVFNKVWAKGSGIGTINVSALDGYKAYKFIHNEAGSTNYLPIWRDSITAAASTPSFSVGVSVVKIRDGASKKYLSGVEYHGYQSVFDIAFEAAGGTGASAIFNRCYNNNYIAKTFAPAGLDSVNIPNQGTNLDASENICLPPGTPPNYNDPYTRTGLSGSQKVRVRLSVANQNSMLQYFTTFIYKATGTSTSSIGNALDLTNTNTLSFCTFGSTPSDAIVCISTESNTYANPITLTGTLYSERGYEYFTDEDKRRVSTAPFTSSWTSSLSSLIAGTGATEAQVRNGIVRYPISSDYTTYNGASGSKSYCRRFTLISASTGYLTVSPFNIGTNLATTVQSTYSTYGNGDYNLMLYVGGIYYDLAKDINTAGTDGTTLATAYGAKVSTVNNLINWSIGTNNTGLTGYFYFLAYFNTANIGLTSVQNDRYSP